MQGTAHERGAALPAIDVRDVSFAYDRHVVVKDASFSIEQGAFATIVGPNGGGKSTILRLVLGLERPDTGSVTVLGATPASARERIGYLPQHARFDPGFPARVIDVVLMGRLSAGMTPVRWTREDLASAERSLSEVGLAERIREPLSSLSGGQRQRALIARAVVSEPELLLLDEPTSHLDVSMEAELHDLLHTLNERMTIVLVSHDLGFVSEHASQVLCVKQTVAAHDSCELSGDTINELYGRAVRVVHHDQAGHERDGSG